MIAAAVAAFVVLASELGQSRQRRDPIKNPFAVVRVQPRLVPLGRAQRTGFVPDRAGDPDSSKIVQVPRDAYGLHLLPQPQHPGSSGCKITHSCRVAMQPGTFQVNQVPEGSCHVGEPVLLDPAYRLWFGVEHRLVGVHLVKIVKQLVSSLDQQVGEIGIELASGAPPDLGKSNVGIGVRRRTSPR